MSPDHRNLRCILHTGQSSPMITLGRHAPGGWDRMGWNGSKASGRESKSFCTALMPAESFGQSEGAELSLLTDCLGMTAQRGAAPRQKSRQKTRRRDCSSDVAECISCCSAPLPGSSLSSSQQLLLPSHHSNGQSLAQDPSTMDSEPLFAEPVGIQSYSQEEWDSHRPTIEHMYRTQRKTTADVRRALQQSGFLVK
jgi:hypothetical protein